MIYRAATLVLSLAAFTFAATPATAQNRGSVGGQAGVTFQSETATVFAGEFTVRLAPVAEIYGSVGRMQDAMPSEIQDILNFVDSSLNASVPALYGISGVRLGLSEGSVRPYGIAGAGLAHLAGKFEYAGRDITSLVEDEIGYSLTSTEFAFELGGGVIIPAGAKAFIDTGYRYMRITGSDMNVSRVYGGFGVRF